MNSSLFSSDRQDWETPQELFDYWNRLFHFTVDSCAYPHNAKLPHYWTQEDDGLAQDWTPHRVWVNPPYKRKAIDLWVKKAAESAEQGALVVMLLPARVDTAWWHSYVQGRADFIYFQPGRVRFEGADSGAPFPSAIAVYLPYRGNWKR